MSEKDDIFQHVQFEKDFVFRSYKSVTSIPDIAITEAIANAWDADAHNVYITLPKQINDEISIEDDGIGMSRDEFRSKWMTLNYNRLQDGTSKDSHTLGRKIYGRNGIGRHGIFCFADEYTVKTSQNGVSHEFQIAISSGNTPFRVIEKDPVQCDKNGTIITAKIERNLPKEQDIIEIIAARFLYDPSFSVYVNNIKVNTLDQKDPVRQETVHLPSGVEVTILVIDSQKTGMKSQQHGVAFWVANRLVGMPSWTHGDQQYLDARLKIAKRYTFIVQADDLIEEVLPDWRGFNNSDKIKEVYRELKLPIKNMISSLMADKLAELRADIIRSNIEEFRKLSVGAKRTLSTFITKITETAPTLNEDYIKAAVDAMLHVQEASRGTILFKKLLELSPREIDNLTELLEKWDIDDIVTVMTEIDRRISVIEAIERLAERSDTDELHVLHPLVLSAKWLFGAEYDSVMFSSNKTLNTVFKKLFNKNEVDPSFVENGKKRPDIVCLTRATIQACCSEKKDENSDMFKPDQILIIELKRGGYSIESKEVSQTENYVRQIKKAQTLHPSATITAFLVGHNIGDVDTYKKSESGTVHVVTYDHLVCTARQKLFSLKDRLQEHYNSLDDKTLVEKILTEPSQLSLNMN